MRNSQPRSLMLIAAATLLGAPQASGTQNPVTVAAIITEIDGRAADVTVIRGDAKLPGATFLQLQDGDRISVQGSRTKIQLRFTDKQSETIAETKDAYVVKARGAPVTLTDKLTEKALALIAKLGHKIDEDAAFPMGSPTGTRGSEIVALRLRTPGLTEGSARVVSGVRRLGLTWEGGKGPYKVLIKRTSGEVLLNATIPQNRVNTIEPRTLVAGGYEVIVEDADGQKSGGTFTVVDAPVSKPLTTEELEWAGPEITKILHACSIASEDDKAWAYEAYLSIIGTEETYKPAKAISERLADGQCS